MVIACSLLSDFGKVFLTGETRLIAGNNPASMVAGFGCVRVANNYLLMRLRPTNGAEPKAKDHAQALPKAQQDTNCCCALAWAWARAGTGAEARARARARSRALALALSVLELVLALYRFTL